MEKNFIKEVKGRKNYGVKRPIIIPLSCFMIGTYDENDIPNILMDSYCCQLDYDKVLLILNPHKTTDNIKIKKAFTISYADVNTVIESDYLGIVSGKKIANKVERAGFTITHSPNVDAPIINEYPMTLECIVTKMGTMDEEGNTYIIGKIVNMSADEKILDKNGKIDLGKLKPIIYDPSNNTYRVIGDIVGYAFKSGKTLM